MRRTSQLGFAGLSSFLAIVALPLGSDRPFFWYLNGAAVALLTALCLTDIKSRQSVPKFRRTSVSVAAGLMLIAILWMVIQLLPMPLELLPDPIWKEASEVLTQSITPRISVDPAATSAMIVRYLTYVLVFLLVAQFSLEPTHRHQLLISVFLITVAQATIGIISLAWGDRILFMEKWAYQGSATGTFVNRNSFATFLAFGLAVGTALMLNKLSAISKADLPKGNAIAMHRKSRATIICLYGFGQVIVGVALLLSDSRMGAVVAIIGVTIAFAMSLTRPGTGRLQSMSLLVAFTAVGAALLFLLGGELIRRFGWLDYSTDVRLLLFSQVLRMIGAHPLTGHGGGTFETAFPTYHQLPLNAEVTWDTAHNLYLELLADLGILGITPILAVTALAFGILRAAWTTQGATAMISAAAVIAIAAAHSTVDFSLQIEANVILFLAVVACGSAEALSAGLGSTQKIAPRGMRVEDHTASLPVRRTVAWLETAAVTFLAGMTLAVSLLGAWREAVPYVNRSASLEERVESILQPRRSSIPLPSWESSTTRRARLTGCLATLNEAEDAVDQNSMKLVDLHRGCLGLVKEFIAMAPMSANEWLVAAVLASNLGDIAAALSYLKMSYVTGPNEQWIAGRRAALAYHLRRYLDPSSTDRLASDLRLILIAPMGMRELTDNCRYDPKLCKFLATFARTPPSLRQELLSTIRGN